MKDIWKSYVIDCALDHGYVHDGLYIKKKIISHKYLSQMADIYMEHNENYDQDEGEPKDEIMMMIKYIVQLDIDKFANDIEEEQKYRNL